jgi:F-type H+-transporting ATPase subunit b
MEIEITKAVALISINATLVVQLISFLIFMMLISRMMYHPLQDIIAERDRQVEQMKEEIGAAEADLEDIFFRIETRTREVKDEAFALQQRLEKDGMRQADALFEGVAAEIRRVERGNQKGSAAGKLRTCAGTLPMSPIGCQGSSWKRRWIGGWHMNKMPRKILQAGLLVFHVLYAHGRTRIGGRWRQGMAADL